MPRDQPEYRMRQLATRHRLAAGPHTSGRGSRRGGSATCPSLTRTMSQAPSARSARRRSVDVATDADAGNRSSGGRRRTPTPTLNSVPPHVDRATRRPRSASAAAAAPASTSDQSSPRSPAGDSAPRRPCRPRPLLAQLDAARRGTAGVADDLLGTDGRQPCRTPSREPRGVHPDRLPSARTPVGPVAEVARPCVVAASAHGHEARCSVLHLVVQQRSRDGSDECTS